MAIKAEGHTQRPGVGATALTSCEVLKHISIVAFPLRFIIVIKVRNICISPRPVFFNPNRIPVTWKALKHTHRFLSPTWSLYSTALQWSSDVLKEASKNRGEPFLSQGAVLPRWGLCLPVCLLCPWRWETVGAQEVMAEWRHGRVAGSHHNVQALGLARWRAHRLPAPVNRPTEGPTQRRAMRRG